MLSAFSMIIHFQTSRRFVSSSIQDPAALRHHLRPVREPGLHQGDPLGDPGDHRDQQADAVLRPGQEPGDAAVERDRTVASLHLQPPHQLLETAKRETQSQAYKINSNGTGININISIYW